MEKLRIAFFGTSDRSIPIVESLCNNFELVLCVTKRDVNIGRHQEKKPTAIKTWAQNKNIPYITISMLKGLELEDVIEQLSKSNIDYILVADFSFIIPEKLIELYPDKIINIHFSLLPKYRGASPVQFAILNRDENTGISYHLVVRKMDRGAVLHQIGYKMAYNETSGFLYDTLFILAARELPEVITKYHLGTITPRSQDELEASYTFSKSHPESTFIYKEDAQLDWSAKTTSIDATIRAFNPWPICWTSLSELEANKRLKDSKLKLRSSINKSDKVKIYSVTLDETELLIINELQPEGKKRMTWEEFKNGYSEAI